MKAVVLVGGFGTRLRPLTFNTPKQLLPVANHPMIDLVVGHLATYGVRECILSLGYKPDAFVAAFPDDTCAGVRLRYAVEPEPLDTAGAIRFAALAGGVDDTFVVVNGDVLTGLDVGALVRFHRARGAEGTIHLTKVDDPSRFGVVPTDDAGRVLAFVEKPPPGEAPTDEINAGTYVLEPSVLSRIAPDRRVSIEREVFPAMVAEGRLYAMATGDYWLDTGTPAALLQANLDVVDGRWGRPREGAVSLEAWINPSARVTRSVVGAGCSVGANAEVVDSVLLAGCIIGPGAQVRRSIVGHRARVSSGADLDELVVLGDDEVVESGTVLRNVRLPDPDATSA